MSKYVTNFQIENDNIIVQDPNAMPKTGGAFTGSVTGTNFTASNNITAGNKVSGSTVEASGSVKGASAEFGAADKVTDTYVAAQNENGEIALNVSSNRGVYDPYSDSWMDYRGMYEGRESYRSQATTLFLNGNPVHKPVDSGWFNLQGTWLRYRKIDKRITVRCDARTNTSLTANAWTTIGTLPVGFRPGYDWYGTGYVVSTNVVLGCYVGTDGKIQVYNPTSTAYDSYSFTAEFGTRDTLARLYLLTYNVGEWANGNGSGMTEDEYQAKIDGMRRFFNSLSADIMFFNEFRDYLDTDNTHEARTVLFPASPWTSFRETDLTSRKNALFSKKSTSNFDTDYLTVNSLSKYIHCTVNIASQIINLYCVHFHHSDATIRDAEMDAVLTLAANKPNVVIAGDFNFETAGDEYKTQYNKALAAGYQISNGGLPGYIMTWHKNNPTHYIDNIMVKGQLEIGAVNVPVQAGDLIPSDHLPLWSFVEVN